MMPCFPLPSTMTLHLFFMCATHALLVPGVATAERAIGEEAAGSHASSGGSLLGQHLFSQSLCVKGFDDIADRLLHISLVSVLVLKLVQKVPTLFAFLRLGPRLHHDSPSLRLLHEVAQREHALHIRLVLRHVGLVQGIRFGLGQRLAILKVLDDVKRRFDASRFYSDAPCVLI